MRVCTRLLAVFAVLVALGCESEETPTVPPIPDADPNRPDAYQPLSIDMSTPAPRLNDAGMAVDGQYGAPCTLDADCVSRICVPDGDGGICSTTCLAECRDFPPDRSAFCRSDPSRGRVEFVCYPKQDLLCEPCVDDSQCDGDTCVETDEGRRCSRGCDAERPCPDEFVCTDGNCQPVSGSCDCNQASAGTSRICEVVNAFGACLGEETCDPAVGWTGCTAPTAEAEVCDGVDQDCDGIVDDGIGSAPCMLENAFGTCQGVSVCLGEDGLRCYGTEATAERCDLLDNDCDDVVDEDFVLADGRYGDPEHCGACNVRCEGRIPNASRVRCDTERPRPACVPEECAPGYQLLGGEACVPLRDITCEACADNASCASRSPGSACLTIGDPAMPETQVQVCGRDCGPDSIFGPDCPDGYACNVIGEGEDAIRQCLPAMGHCLCRGNVEGFSLPCSVTSPLNDALTCNGRRGCDGDDFGECVLPAEACDGIDNDCDGLLDEGFRSADGRYDLDPLHCGRCNFDCAMLAFPNATAVCNRGRNVPACEMRCSEGFVDLDNGTDDGCECEVVPGEDHPDGLDRNCDGIDGDRSRALFVSKVGDDFAVGTPEAPLLTITRALEQAADPEARVRDIYVATGVYSENITLVNGVNVYGGYALGFRERDREEHPTTILGRPPARAVQGTVSVQGLDQPTRLDGFDLYGANAVVAGSNSVAVLITDTGANFTLSNNEIIAGNGGPGARGIAGVPGDFGRDGQVGDSAFTTPDARCRDVIRGGGAGGQNQCGRVTVSGGAGGDSSCPQSQEDNGNIPCNSRRSDQCRNSCDASPCNPLPPPQGVGASGEGPGDAPGGEATYDRWHNTGDCSLCGLFPGLPHLGRPGTNGPDGPSGAAGEGCDQPIGQINERFVWITDSGRPGQSGIAGTGGGGGSAGSGLDAEGAAANCRDTLGGGGGGGGAGGCGGSAGAGGQGGGGSFAILVAFGPAGIGDGGLPRLTNNRIFRGVGGSGGTGGAGGIGGVGGEGAVGGISSRVFCAEPGGRGGNGGAGGHGGGGGGGCGGISASIYVSGANRGDVAIYEETNVLLESGRAGVGGQGGGSTGNPGTPGLDGVVMGLIVQ